MSSRTTRHIGADEAAWARALKTTGVAPHTIANPSGFPGGSPGGSDNHRYYNEEQPPQPGWMTPDPSQQPGGAPTPQPALQIFPPWYQPPPGAQLFGPQTDTLSAGVPQLPAGAGSEITIPGLSYLTPNAMISVVRLVTIFVANPDATFNVSYYLRNNGQSLLANPFRMFSFIAGAIVFPYPVTIRDIPPGTIDMLIVNNGAGGPWTVGGGFSGWSYTQAQAAALTGGLPN
jgi:hypothetical protein